jgi:hypothetical protein
LGTLVVAWVVVVGLAFAPVGIYFMKSGNVLVPLAFAAAGFTVGLALFVAMGIARAGAHAKKRKADEGRIVDLHKRGAVFGGKR